MKNKQDPYSDSPGIFKLTKARTSTRLFRKEDEFSAIYRKTFAQALILHAIRTLKTWAMSSSWELNLQVSYKRVMW